MAVSSRRQFSAEKGICHMSETTITQLPEKGGALRDAAFNIYCQRLGLMGMKLARNRNIYFTPQTDSALPKKDG